MSAFSICMTVSLMLIIYKRFFNLHDCIFNVDDQVQFASLEHANLGYTLRIYRTLHIKFWKSFFSVRTFFDTGYWVLSIM